MKYQKSLLLSNSGPSFSDVANLTPHHIAIGTGKEKWTFTNRQKPNTASHISLLPPAMEIVNKYKAHPVAANKGKLLPMLSNKKMNAYLKEIADLCGIEGWQHRKRFIAHRLPHTAYCEGSAGKKRRSKPEGVHGVERVGQF